METLTGNTGTVAAPGIKRSTTKGGITIDGDLYTSQWQKKGTLSAQLRQVFNTISEYPSARVSNSLNGNIFEEGEFGFDSQMFEAIENRVAWIDVPETMTLAQVAERLAKFPNAVLYKILDNKPILSDTQENAIVRQLRTYDEFALSQAVRYPATHENPDLAGKLILDRNGKLQYRGVFFAPEGHADVDLRKPEAEYGYVPEELKAELEALTHDATVIPSQTLNG